MTILLVHGWGYDAGVWDAVAEALPGHDIVRADFGYFGEEEIPQGFPEPILAVGHSLGTLWLLTQKEYPLKGFMSIAGFDNFAAHISPQVLKAMQMGLTRNTPRTLRDFWTACGTPSRSDTDKANEARLTQGLHALETWDGTLRLKELKCPIRALAARDDKIVSEEMTKAIWPEENLRWSDTGGHALPQTKPDWCAQEIADFAQSL